MAPNHHEDEDHRALTDKLIQDVAGILDPHQRLFLITESLRRLPAADIAEVLRIVTYRALHHEPRFQDFFNVISDVKVLARKLGYGKMAEIYAIARRNSYEDVVRFLQILPPAKRLGDDDKLEMDPLLQDLTLGHKRELARTRDPDLLNRLLHDQDPIVIQNLLKNPRVTIKEVVKIASKRPTSPEVLWMIYRDLKWSNHYVVRMALANNPYTPTEISMSLLHFLMENDLVDVAENTILHSRLRDAAIAMILQKRKGPLPHPRAEAAPPVEAEPADRPAKEKSIPETETED